MNSSKNWKKRRIIEPRREAFCANPHSEVNTDSVRRTSRLIITFIFDCLELKDERNRLEKEVFNTSHTSDASVSSTSSPSNLSHSPRTSFDASAVVATTRAKGPLRALPTDPSATHKPRLSIDRKAPPTAKSTTPVLLRLGSIKQKDLLNYPSESSAAARMNSADRFRRMVLDCRDVSS